ncbi:hypothetical protein CK203_027599 [Vitis vinifera]|uniref:Uncharacterized protein n=1 Tax=Vitis vinifera TaxID=29760 RepID=A0A438IHE6_VITVI|nr:hypothetical protein CK203_027599 [Vitis vinifera]
MFFHLDLSLLEVLFVYTIKKGKKDMFSMFAHIPSFQLVIGLLYSNKRGAKWHVLDRRGRLVEWVEKASFIHLNKLFEITTNERNHHMLLSARNLLAVIRELQSYVFPIISRQLPKILKHQEHLDQRDERRQEGTLRRASSEKGRISSSAACPSVKKKKSSAKAVKDSIPALTLLSVSTPSTSNSTNSSALALDGNLDLPNFERNDSGIRHFESKPIELDTINKPKVEEGMATDLRVDFNERHYKCLHEHGRDDRDADRSPAFVSARLLFDTPKFVISHIQQLQDYNLGDCESGGSWSLQLVHQRDLLFERLEVVETMRAFIFHYMSSGEKLRGKLEPEESDLATTEKAIVEGAEA